MSFKFDSASLMHMTGTLGTTYNEPITLFAFVKHVDHPATLQTVLGLGETTTSPNSSLMLRYLGTTERYNTFVTDTANGSTGSIYEDTVQDNTWFGMVGKHSAENVHTVYIRTFANSDNDTTSRTTNAMGFVRVGRGIGGSNYFGAANPNESKIAEVGIVSGSTPTDQQITDYLNGVALSSLGFSTDLKLYVPMSTDSVTNLGSDSLAALTKVNAPTFDSDHPTISSGLAPIRLIWRV